MATVKGGDQVGRKLADLVRSVGESATLSVGFAEGATYPDGTSVPAVAALNEYGRPNKGQPPRPFFRRMLKENRDGWADTTAKLLRANDYDAKRAMEQLGAVVAGQLQKSIVDLVDPPLAPSTVARKGFDKPLINTSLMLKSVTHQVE